METSERSFAITAPLPASTGTPVLIYEVVRRCRVLLTASTAYYVGFNRRISATNGSLYVPTNVPIVLYLNVGDMLYGISAAAANNAFILISPTP